MPYQVSYTRKGRRNRTSTAYLYKPDAQRYADELNKNLNRANARVVAANKGTYDVIKKYN